MNSPVFRIAQESTETLKAMRAALLSKDVQHGTEDWQVLAAIREELNTRALGTYDETGFPKALHDEPDEFKW